MTIAQQEFLSQFTLPQLLAEVKRRSGACLLAVVRSTDKGELQVVYESRGAWELLKYLHAKTEARLECQAQAEIKHLSAHLESVGSIETDDELSTGAAHG